MSGATASLHRGAPGLRLARTGLGIVGLLALWELAARLTAGAFLIAGPFDVAAYIANHAAALSGALGVTLQSAFWGFILGNAFAIALAVAALLMPPLAPVLSVLALLIFCLPIVATGPILRVLYGPGAGPQITLAALAVYYTTFLCLMVGLRAAPASWFDLVRTYGRGRFTELVQVRLHTSLPYLIAGLQIAAPAAFLGAMVGEFTGAERGMGVLTIRAMRGLDVSATWALALVASLVSMTAYWGLGWMGRRLGMAPPALIMTPPKETRAGSTARIWAIRLVTGCLTIGLVLALWQGSMDAFGLNPYFAKRPEHVWAFLVTAPEAEANRAILFGAFGQTLSLAALGYGLGLVIGAGLAAAMVLVPGLSTMTLPIAIALRSIPIVVTAPLIVVALGRGAIGTVVIVAIMIFFPTLVACLQGMRQTPGQVNEVFASYAASPWRRLIHAQFPAMLPAFFASARMAVPAAFLAATTAEWLATGIGIGGLMAVTASTSSYTMLWSAIVVISVFATLAYLVAGMIEQAVLRIYAAEQTV